MVRVTKANFEPAYAAFAGNLSDAAFVAIDLEMSGIQISGPDEHSLSDGPAVRYRKMCAVATRYSVIQFGICPFVAASAGAPAGDVLDAVATADALVAAPFAVFTFPHAGARDRPDSSRDVVLSPSAIAFLRHHGMDFQAWIGGGVPYVDARGEAKLRGALAEREAAADAAASGAPPSAGIDLAGLRPADAAFVAAELARAAAWLAAAPAGAAASQDASDAFAAKHCSAAELVLKPCNGFLRRVLYEQLETRGDLLPSLPKGARRELLVQDAVMIRARYSPRQAPSRSRSAPATPHPRARPSAAAAARLSASCASRTLLCRCLLGYRPIRPCVWPLPWPRGTRAPARGCPFT
jgi:hypothetical protein